MSHGPLNTFTVKFVGAALGCFLVGSRSLRGLAARTRMHDSKEGPRKTIAR